MVAIHMVHCSNPKTFSLPAQSIHPTASQLHPCLPLLRHEPWLRLPVPPLASVGLSSKSRRRQQRRLTGVAAAALPFGVEAADLLSPPAVSLMAVLGFGALRTAVYYRVQYIAAAMLGRHVPRNGARVVDIALRSGINLYYLPNDVDKVYAVAAPGANPNLLKSQALDAGVDVSILTGGPESIGIPSGTIDAVVSVYGFSNVADDKVGSVLSEVARVLKPGGKFVFVENVGAPGGIVRLGQEVLEKIYRTTGLGSHTVHDLLPLIKATRGLEDVQFDVALEFQDPHLVGVAMKSKVAATGGDAASSKAGTPASRAERRSKQRK